MKYRRMRIEMESPEEYGYSSIRCNLAESSFADQSPDFGKLIPPGLKLAYNDHRGLPELRELIAAMYPDTLPSDVLVTAGASSALFIVQTALLEKGKGLMVQFPNYATLLETPYAIGAEINKLEMDFDAGFEPTVPTPKEVKDKKIALISFTSPHNPTGSVLSEENWDLIGQLGLEAGVPVLMDETYRDFLPEGATGLNSTFYPSLIRVSSLSKAFGLPGLRIGWIITRNKELYKKFLAAKEQIFICNSLVDEVIAAGVLNGRDTWRRKISTIVEEGKETVKKWIRGETRLEWVEPRAGVVCFPGIAKSAGIDATRFHALLWEREKILVGRGSWFDCSDHYFRIGFGWPGPEELKTGLEGISRTLDFLQSR
jgi:aspartate/methionine/tyrosine aminotransferase